LAAKSFGVKVLIADDYLVIAVFTLLVLIIPPLVFFMTRLMRPIEGGAGTQSFMLGHTIFRRTSDRYKHDTFECGEEPEGDAQIDFHFQYYMYGIMFVVADILVVFLMLWGIGYDGLSDWAKFMVFTFLGLMLLGVWYALKKIEVIYI
jgi:NADH:ubiquinone oxidoreductase subunit 3 (subunit A)